MFDLFVLISILTASIMPFLLLFIHLSIENARHKIITVEGSLHNWNASHIFGILKITHMNYSYIYHLRFKKPVNGKRDFYFFSLAAIFDHFSEEAIGCHVRKLWDSGISNGTKFANEKCTIKREKVYRKPQSRDRNIDQ